MDLSLFWPSQSIWQPVKYTNLNTYYCIDGACYGQIFGVQHATASGGCQRTIRIQNHGFHFFPSSSSNGSGSYTTLMLWFHFVEGSDRADDSNEYRFQRGRSGGTSDWRNTSTWLLCSSKSLFYTNAHSKWRLVRVCVCDCVHVATSIGKTSYATDIVFSVSGSCCANPLILVSVCWLPS